MSEGELIGCPAVLAMELTEGARPARNCLDREQAASLATLIADDLRALLPEVEHARLAVAGAHFDTAELLRPTFPVFATVQELASRLNGEVVAFGAHEGRMPAQALQPDPSLAGAALRLIPWTLLASPTRVNALGQAMEVELVGRGEVSTRTADFLMRALDVPLQHARYLTRHDLMALICVQYEHVNLAPLWSLLEAALLSADSEESVLSARGLELRYADAQVHAQTPTAWLAAQTSSGETLTHALAGVIFELRQYAAMLSAHRLPLVFVDGDYDATQGWLIETLATPDADADPPTLHAHDAPGLGTVGVSVSQRVGSGTHTLAHAWLLGGRLEALCDSLSTRFGSASTLQDQQHLGVGADHRLLLAR